MQQKHGLQQMHTRPTDFANRDIAGSHELRSERHCCQLAEEHLGVSPRLQKRYDSTAGGSKRSLLLTIVSPERCSLLELQAGIKRWESAVSQYEEKSKNKMNDEIKLTGLEALVPKELEKHLILNSNRLRTLENTRREVVMYVEK